VLDNIPDQNNSGIESFSDSEKGSGLDEELLNHETPFQQPMPIIKKKFRRNWTKVPFSEIETKNLLDGVKRFGKSWSVILSNYEFNNRTATSLKDKYRNLKI